MRLKKIEFITPFLLVLLNLVVKILFISSNSLGGDEPFSVYHAQMDLASIVHQLSTGNNPPLYEILLHFWIKIFGISEFSVRLPSVLFSAFAVVYIFKIGKDFFSFQVGLVAALLFSFSNFNLLLAHEARVYAMLTFFTSLSMYYFLLLLRNPATIRYRVTILVANTILIYSHYFGFFIIAIQALSVFFFQNCRRTISRNYLVVLSGVLVLYIPNIPIVVTRYLDSAAHGTWVAAPDGMDSIYNMLRTFSNQPLTTVVCCVLLVLSVFGLVVNTGSRQTEKKIIVLWFLFPFSFMFAFSYWLPIFFDRYLIFVSLGYYLLLAIIVVYVLQRKSYSYALSCILVMLYLVTFNPNKDNKRHVKETITKI
ncbi:MAG TPA: glycosyltransferase family 39 protein, partial [Bacteroidales bacterium]|nr:glycosyltransferase family 39 protein [Bacteroidales bacterium]